MNCLACLLHEQAFNKREQHKHAFQLPHNTSMHFSCTRELIKATLHIKSTEHQPGLNNYYTSTSRRPVPGYCEYNSPAPALRLYQRLQWLWIVTLPVVLPQALRGLDRHRACGHMHKKDASGEAGRLSNDVDSRSRDFPHATS